MTLDGLLDCFLADVWSDKPPVKYEIYLLEIHSNTFIKLLVAKHMLSFLKGMILLLVIIKEDKIKPIRQFFYYPLSDIIFTYSNKKILDCTVMVIQKYDFYNWNQKLRSSHFQSKFDYLVIITSSLGQISINSKLVKKLKSTSSLST